MTESLRTTCILILLLILGGLLSQKTMTNKKKRFTKWDREYVPVDCPQHADHFWESTEVDRIIYESQFD